MQRDGLSPPATARRPSFGWGPGLASPAYGQPGRKEEEEERKEEQEEDKARQWAARKKDSNKKDWGWTGWMGQEDRKTIV